MSSREALVVAIVAGLLLAPTVSLAESDTAGAQKPAAKAPGTIQPSAILSSRPTEATFEYTSAGKRDPFRPLALDRKTVADVTEPLSPLQHYDIGQLKLVGLIYDSSPPRAMVEDSAGLGFIVSPGTPIGPNGGVVTSIRPRQVVVEEWYNDVIGDRHRREIVLELPSEQGELNEVKAAEARR
jgi:Tfp pilus assembly protein PilP